MNDPIALFLVVAVIALALVLGVLGDLKAAWASVRRGAEPEKRSERGGYETIRTNVQPDTHWRDGRPLHRNFGLSKAGAVYSQHPALVQERPFAEMAGQGPDLPDCP